MTDIREIRREEIPSLAISLYKEYRGQGIGSQLLRRMLALMRCRLAV